jgi:hypothetical protein
MLKYCLKYLLLSMLFVLGGAVCTAQATMLRLGGMQFDPLAGTSDAESGFSASAVDEQTYSASNGFSLTTGTQTATDHYYIVQFDGPILSEWRQALVGAGATVMDYVPDFAFIVRLPEDDQEVVSVLPHVRWVGPYAVDYRISLEARALSMSPVDEDATQVGDDGQTRLRIDAFPGESSSTISAWIMDLGGSVQDVSESEWGIRLSVVVPMDKVDDVAEIPGVKWVEIRRTPRASNDKAVRIVGVSGVRTGKTTDLLGTGQVVAVCDSGLDKGDAEDIHPDFLDGSKGTRVKDIFRWGDYTSSRDKSGHGTHVSGSILGNGQQSGSDPANNSFPETSFTGMAPKARLVFQASGNPDVDSSSMPGIPADLKILFQQALDAAATIHSNSWGTAGTGAYDGESVDVDQFCWSNKNFLILFAAGNSGQDRDRDGVIDKYSLDTPGTAKNCLTVGASESLRATGGYSEDAWGAFVSAPDPIGRDLTSNNTMGLAAFSSRGPCVDGRFKPDLVAPGTNILSTRSSVQGGDGWGTYNDWYYYSGGTSMATPVTAGTTALLREYLTTQVSQFTSSPPSSAMLKACLTNAAQNMEPGQYGSGQYKEISATPGPVAGWGLLNLAGAVYPESPNFITYTENTSGLTTDQEVSYTVNNVTDDDELRVTLAWTDYPAAASANGGLVNDLDLLVRDQDGNVYYPDNAQTQTSFTTAKYYDSSATATVKYANRIAIRLSPDSYPKRLTSLHWGAEVAQGAYGSVEVAVYKSDTSGLPTGEALFSKTLQEFGEDGALPVGIDVTEGDVVAVFTFADSLNMGLMTTPNNVSGRTHVDMGSGWQLADVTAAVVGVFFTTNTSGTFDRVNNLLGVTIDKPFGTYTVTVRGYNVPQGPQPFALVVSGTNGETGEQQFEAIPSQPDAPTYSSLSQSFKTMSTAQISETYELSLDSVYGQVAEYTASISGGSDLAALRRAMTFDANHTVSDLSLYKLYSDGTDARAFTYSDLGEFEDGMWWLSEVDGERLTFGSAVESGRTYYVNSVAKDNGLYDLSTADDVVHEPQVLGTSGASPTPTPTPSDGGGGGGCTAGTSGVAPWLLAALAMCVLILRRRV